MKPHIFTMPFERIALIGATGALGHHILSALLKAFPPTLITILTRQTSSPPTLPPGVKVITLPSYTNHTAVVAALKGHDVLVSALSTPALDIEPQLVELAIEAGVRRFMPSEYTMDVCDTEYKKVATTPVARRRVEWAEKLEKIAAEGKIEFTTIVPGPFVDYCLETGFWPYDIKGKRATLYDGGEIKRTGCSLKFTGECVASALRMGEAETKNRRIRVSEVEYTGKKLLDALEKAEGEKWTVEHKVSRDLLREEEQLMETGKPDEAYYAFVVRGNFDDSPAGLLIDGLEYCKDRDLKVPRRSLVDIVDETVRKTGDER